MKRIAILGSTGSIGRQTLEVARWRGYRVAGLAAGSNHELLLKQVHEFSPELVSCSAEVAAQVEAGLPAGTRLVAGPAGSAEVAALEVDSVIAAIPGMAGLVPLRTALQSGRNVALAGKEAMVIAGPLIRQLLAEHGGRIIPVDSEHSALFQCLQGEPAEAVASLVLTASGGPFLHGPPDLSQVTPAQALRHPNWSMGKKVTVDSATLFNKGLEVLEAHALFHLPLDRIEVVIHPQSLVHGLVRFTDGQIKAQIGPPDMRLPLQYGIEWPARPATPLAPLPLTGTWEFLAPDPGRFPALELAYRAGRSGGLAPAYLNAADEIAVEAFLAGRIPFTAISRVLASVMDAAPRGELTWDALLAADREARSLARELTEAGSTSFP
jgi:1-deoxy-D-xylulose-5-phosphate reductoisomerase